MSHDLRAIDLEDHISNPKWAAGGIAPRAEADICNSEAAFSSLLELEGDARNGGSGRASAHTAVLSIKVPRYTHAKVKATLSKS